MDAWPPLVLFLDLGFLVWLTSEHAYRVLGGQ